VSRRRLATLAGAVRPRAHRPLSSRPFASPDRAVRVPRSSRTPLDDRSLQQRRTRLSHSATDATTAAAVATSSIAHRGYEDAWLPLKSVPDLAPRARPSPTRCDVSDQVDRARRRPGPCVPNLSIASRGEYVHRTELTVTRRRGPTYTLVAAVVGSSPHHVRRAWPPRFSSQAACGVNSMWGEMGVKRAPGMFTALSAVERARAAAPPEPLLLSCPLRGRPSVKIFN
jgi:hypothetical protein